MTLPNFSAPISDLRPIVDLLEGKVGEIGLYCQNPSCVVREFTLTIKPYGEDIPMRPSCPFCRSDTHVVFSFLRTRQQVHEHALDTALTRLAYELVSQDGFVNTGALIDKAEELRKQFTKSKE